MPGPFTFTTEGLPSVRWGCQQRCESRIPTQRAHAWVVSQVQLEVQVTRLDEPVQEDRKSVV